MDTTFSAVAGALLVVAAIWWWQRGVTEPSPPSDRPAPSAESLPVEPLPKTKRNKAAAIPANTARAKARRTVLAAAQDRFGRDVWNAIDAQDRRAVKLARTEDEKAHAMLTSMLNHARGKLDYTDEDDLLAQMFADGGAEYRARAERLAAAAARPRGELTDAATQATGQVLGDVELVELMLTFAWSLDVRIKVASVNTVWAAAARMHPAWIVCSNVIYPDYTICTGVVMSSSKP